MAKNKAKLIEEIKKLEESNPDFTTAGLNLDELTKSELQDLINDAKDDSKQDSAPEVATSDDADGEEPEPTEQPAPKKAASTPAKTSTQVKTCLKCGFHGPTKETTCKHCKGKLKHVD